MSEVNRYLLLNMNPSSRQHEGRVTIVICAPRELLKIISIPLDGFVCSLETLYNGRKRIFIYNGNKMDPTQTYRSYGIREGDYIISIPSSISEENESRWISMSRDADSFIEAMRGNLNIRTCREAARLRDLQMDRIEKRSRNYQRILSSYMNLEENHDIEFSMKIPFIISTAKEPSTKALPLLW